MNHSYFLPPVAYILHLPPEVN